MFFREPHSLFGFLYLMFEIAFLFAAKEKREVKPRWPKIPE